MKINLKESLNKIDLATNNKYDLLNTFNSKKLSDNSKKRLAEAIENNSIASINRVLHESEEKVFTVKVYQNYPFVAEVIDNSIIDKNGEGKVLKKFTNRDALDAFAGELISKGYVNYQGYSKNKSLRESEEQLFKVVIQSGTVKRNFESALYEDEAEEIVDYYGGRWIDENGFEWNMYIEEDDDSTEHAMVDNSYGMEDDDERAQREMDAYDQSDRDWEYVESLNELNEHEIEGPVKLDRETFDRMVRDNNLLRSLNDSDFTEVRDYFTRIGYPNKAAATNDLWHGSNLGKTRDWYDELLDKYLNESLTEASYGGAYDIEDDMFFTKEEIVDFVDGICTLLNDKFGYQYDIEDVWMDTPTKLHISIYDSTHDFSIDGDFRIDMRRIKRPQDLIIRYTSQVFNVFEKKFEDEYQYYNFDESLTEDTIKQNGKWVNKGSEGTHGKFRTKKAADAQRKAMFTNGYKAESLKEAIDDEIDFDYETDFDDDGVEEGNTFIEGGVEYAWIQREAGPLYLDFDKWAVWSARVFVDPREFMTIHDNGKGYDFDGDAFKEKAMAAPIVYFVVEEDTGFIDWGPEDNEIAAKDFLNGKKEDWENDMSESLNEDKELNEYYTVNLHYEDVGDGREYDYEADYNDVLEYLMEICVDDDNAPEDTQEYIDWVEVNFDYLLKKYEYKVLNYFEEDASQEEYDRRHSSYEPEYDPMN